MQVSAILRELRSFECGTPEHEGALERYAPVQADVVALGEELEPVEQEAPERRCWGRGCQLQTLQPTELAADSADIPRTVATAPPYQPQLT